jgi:uncharacterized membrane protein YvlD (DUF360 family)
MATGSMAGVSRSSRDPSAQPRPSNEPGRSRPHHPGQSYRAPWRPEPLRIRPLRLFLFWATAAVALLAATAIAPGASIEGLGGAFLVVAVVAVLNTFIPPLVAAIRIPFTLVLGLVLVLVVDAAMLLAADALTDGTIALTSFWDSLLVALMASAASIVLQMALGMDDEERYALRVAQRVADRSGEQVETDSPGIIFLEIDGLALPVLQRAMRDGSAPTLARWLATDTHRLTEWETDLSSQTGASQAGILLGSNEDIPAFRWFKRKPGR